MSPSDATLPTVVIVGAGFGGLRAARRMRGLSANVIVIDKRNHHLFQPLLYQVATAGLSSDDIAFPIRDVLRRHLNTTVLMTEVIGVDKASKRVITRHGPVPYDYLVLAVGSEYNYFGHDEWEKCAPKLKSLTDAMRIREKILSAFEAAEMEEDPEKRRRLMTFVLVGAGPTGVELAGAISELARRSLAKDFRRANPREARILLLDAESRILGGFPEKLAEDAKEALEARGVEVLSNARVESVDSGGVRVGGEFLPASNVLWTAGVKAPPVGKWLDAETDRAGRVMVERDLSLPGSPNIFVIGDSAFFPDERGKPLPGLAPVAMQQGEYVANVIENRLEGREPAGGFHYHDKGNLATVGRSFAIAEIGKLKLAGFIAWVLWLAVHIFYLIGARNRALVLLQWGWAYFSFSSGARVIQGEEEPGSSVKIKDKVKSS